MDIDPRRIAAQQNVEKSALIGGGEEDFQSIGAKGPIPLAGQLDPGTLGDQVPAHIRSGLGADKMRNGKAGAWHNGSVHHALAFRQGAQAVQIPKDEAAAIGQVDNIAHFELGQIAADSLDGQPQMVRNIRAAHG